MTENELKKQLTAIDAQRAAIQERQAALQAELDALPAEEQAARDAFAVTTYADRVAELGPHRAAVVTALKAYESALWACVDAHAALTGAIRAHDELHSSLLALAKRNGLSHPPEGIPATWPKPEPALFGGQRGPAEKAKEQFSKLFWTLKQWSYEV